MMNYTTASQLLINLDVQIHSHSYDSAIRALKKVAEHLSPTFCIPTHHDYSEKYAQETLFFFTLHLTGHENPQVKNEANKLVKHWSFILASIGPTEFLRTIQDLMKQSDALPVIYKLLPAVGHAIRLIGYDETLHYFSIIYQLVNIVLEKKLDKIPIEIWESIGRFAPEQEILKLIQKNLNLNFAKIAPTLIKKNQKAYTGLLFKEASSDFLNIFFENCPKGYVMDYDELISRASKTCEKLGNAGFDSTCLLFAKMINYNSGDFTENQQTEIKKLLTRIKAFIVDDHFTSSAINSMLSALVAGAKKNLFSKEELTELNRKIKIKDDFPTLHLTYLESLIFCLDGDSDQTSTLKFIMNFVPWFGQIYIDYLKIISENYIKIRSIDQKFFSRLLWSIVHPIPLDKTIAIAIVKFLLSLDVNDILDVHVDLNIGELVLAYLEIDCKELSELVKEFAIQLKYSPPISRINLFGKNSIYYLRAVRDADFSFTLELLESQILDPRYRYAALNLIKTNPLRFLGFTNSLVELLSTICRSIGIDIDSIFWKASLPKLASFERYIRTEELEELFASVKGPIEESDFGLFVNATLEAIEYLLIKESNMTKENISMISLMCAHLSPLFPGHCISIVARLTDLYHNHQIETVRTCLSNSHDIICAPNRIPMKFSQEMAKFGITCFGLENVEKKIPKYMLSALSQSRAIADQMKGTMKQPFPPLPTFLSFVGMKNHSEWVDICQQVIDPHDWILTVADLDLINQLPRHDGIDEIHKIAIEKLNDLQRRIKVISPVRVDYNYNLFSNKFKLSEIKITEGPKVHEGEEGTLSALTSFLWHSNMKLPSSLTPEVLESIVLENNRNPRLLIGFFSWANSNKYKINIKKWAEKFILKRYTSQWIFALATFLSNIQMPFADIPIQITLIMQKCLTAFGYPVMTRSSIVFGFQRESGIKWLIFRNILAIDPSFFSEYPLIVAELTNNMDTFKKYFDELVPDQPNSMLDMFIGINNVIFKPEENEMTSTHLIPSNCSYHPQILSFRDISILPAQKNLARDLLESIISCMQRQKVLPYDYFAFFMNVKMTREQFDRVHDMFWKNRSATNWTRKFMLPALFLSETGKSESLQNDAIRFYSNKPPSITRAFYRSLLCSFAPPIKQNLIKRVETKLSKVFPELCYAGFAKSGITIWDTASPLSKLRFGFVDAQIGNSLLCDMKNPSNEAITIYKLLFGLPDEDLAVAQNWATKGMIRDELARVLLETATNDNSYVSFAVDVINVLDETIGPENVMVLVGNKDFLNKKNFLCALVAFATLLKTAKAAKKTDIVDFLKVFQNPETGIVENEAITKLFTKLEEEENIAKLIHLNQF